MIELVCVSDLHLGEGESVQYRFHNPYQRVFATLSREIRKIAGNDRRIGTFVLLGDIPDISEAETDAFPDAAAFIRRLTRRFQINHLVFVPGNHDHHLLDLAVGRRNLLKHLDVRKNPHGILPLPSSAFRDKAKFTDLFNGCKVGKLSLCYPNFEYLSRNRKRLFWFTHGHLFSNSVLTVGAIRHPLARPSKARSVKTLVSRTYGVIEFIWERTTFPGREELYEALRSTEHHIFKAKGKKRLLRYLLGVCRMERRIQQMRRRHPALQSFNFVFGHTHDGFHDRWFTNVGRVRTPIDIFNTGGWLVVSRDFIPHTKVFAILGDGETVFREAYYDNPTLAKIFRYRS